MPVLVIIVLASAGYLRSTEFKCTDNAQCSSTGSMCEMNGYCSFTDSSCASGRRYGEFSGSVSSKCVGEEGPNDGGIDTPDMTMSTCPTGYNTLPNAGTHKYSKIGSAAIWSTQRDRCATAGANVYLSVPDDMAELSAITMLSGAAKTWVGLTDAVTEGTWLTVRGTSATYLPWDTSTVPPQPDNSGPQEGSDCASASNTAPLLYDERCDNTSYPAVCECDP